MDKLSSWLSIENKADKEATIKIRGYIGIPEYWQFDDAMKDKIVSTKEKMASELKEIADLKVNSIILDIDSFGGDVNHGIAIYNAVIATGAAITTRYTAWSASVATIIGAAGKGNIEMPDNSMILVHQARTISWGVAAEIETTARELRKVDDILLNIYEKQTGNKKSVIRELMARNNGNGEWINAKEAKEYGLIDRITQPLKAAATADKYNFKAYGLPEVELPRNNQPEEPELTTQSIYEGLINHLKTVQI